MKITNKFVINERSNEQSPPRKSEISTQRVVEKEFNQNEMIKICEDRDIENNIQRKQKRKQRYDRLGNMIILR